MFEWHNGILSIESRELYPSLISWQQYKNYTQRSKIRVVRKGGRNHPALVAWTSLNKDLKEAIKLKIGGDPEEIYQRNLFAEMVELDQKAHRFFSQYELPDGGYLPHKRIDEYTANASVMNAMQTVIQKVKSQRRGSLKEVWERLPDMVQGLPRDRFTHSLPRNERRLRDRLKAYNRDGYASLIHKGYCNTNSEKLSDKTKAWILARWADRVHRCPTIKKLRSEYNLEAKVRQWTAIRSDKTIRDYLYSADVKHLWYGHRYGDAVSKETFRYQHTTRLPERRDSLWYSDGTKLNYYYQYTDKEGRQKIGTLQVYEVMDVYSEVMLGYHISKTEDYEAQYCAFRMAIEFAEHKPYEIKYDNQGGHKKLESGHFLTKVAHKAIRTKPYNGKSKTIESAFGRFQSQILKQDWFFTGQNITAKSLESRADRNFIMANKDKLPTLNELQETYAKRRQEWNESDHPRSGKSRLETYLSSTNSETQKIDRLDMIDIFWIQRPKTVRMTAMGLTFQEKGQKYTYVAIGPDGLPDMEFLRSNIDKSFVVKYDPYDFSCINLYETDANGDIRFVTMAEEKVVVHRASQDQEDWEQAYLKAIEEKVKDVRVRDHEEIERVLAEHGRSAEDYGFTDPGLLGIKGTRQSYEGKISKAVSNLDHLDFESTPDDDDYDPKADLLSQL